MGEQLCFGCCVFCYGYGCCWYDFEVDVDGGVFGCSMGVCELIGDLLYVEGVVDEGDVVLVGFDEVFDCELIVCYVVD